MSRPGETQRRSLRRALRRSELSDGLVALQAGLLVHRSLTRGRGGIADDRSPSSMEHEA